MTYKCLIIDDEKLARGLIKTHLSQLEDFELVASCGSAIEASMILQKETIDLLFLDIEMPVLKGTDFFKNLVHKPKVIFTTAYRDYAVEGFELNAVDYILKPITFQRFFNAIEKFRTLQRVSSSEPVSTPENKDAFIYIRKDRKQVKVYLDAILYIESLKDYVKIHLEKENHITKSSISAFEEKLDERFIRVHRSYIINKDKIAAYTKNDIEIGNIEIPIGENFRNNLASFLT
ncbi:DNA-binding LytR/AlgR family response regulator [Aquimarina sp. EL_43]|uniref:LytR/AlgR family response regulator transcription factor n=2 Tax=Aquimarina TaxID=290174 RepID=UPI0018CA5840|nr:MULTISPECIES: LytTR family DNA-binding domain-containing protein [unclassified Aquimarina]MBG6130846.1 DNA-binding LytR/AlgR family response regulator [Aquimarina sp. EL_35]MBG6151007.1 DNA-binding LytR/AlgR family response regulator [Aquimarina sp. EL_32]MBG6169236.1 DNA-binding LytR/AlgR family response regulator [Aquimarina sp. EL_43]